MEIAEISADQNLRVQAMAAAPALAQLAQPCGDRAVQLALQPLVLVFGVGEAARVPAFWKPYRILAELPAEALAKAVDEYCGQPDAEFFPKPGPLKALGDKHAETIRKAASRAKRAAALPPPKPRAEVSHTEVLRLARATADSLAKASPSRARADLPNTAGKPDETGLTPAMRDVISRQRAQADQPALR